jgi:myo-inositol-1(or 4)-monophosphatase
MKKELDILLTTIKAAGDAVETFCKNKKKIAVIQKQNQSPLTEADLLANEILKKGLLENFPEDGWLSEETVDDSIRLQRQRVWIVDPIDGTKEFVSHIPEYAVSVALIDQHIPIISAVYNPSTQELVYAVQGQGTWCNGKLVQCNHLEVSKLHILASRTEYKAGEWDELKKCHTVQAVGSIAYKLGLIAKGEANATFSLTPKSEWDIAAGALLVEEAGGIVTGLDGKRFMFNQRNTRVNGVVASSKKIYNHVFEIVQTAYIS